MFYSSNSSIDPRPKVCLYELAMLLAGTLESDNLSYWLDPVLGHRQVLLWFRRDSCKPEKFSKNIFSRHGR